MKDEMNRNLLTVTGTPTLVTGALSVDTDQGMLFNGTTNSAAAADSTSLSLTSSMSVEFFMKIGAIPGSTLSIVDKASSYTFQINSAGKVQWKLQNSPSIVTVTATNALSTNTWYHIVGTYNDNYAGAQQFGYSTPGGSVANIGDASSNISVSKFTLPEAAILNTVTLYLQYFDEIWSVETRALVYADNGGVPGALVTQSGIQTLYPPTPAWRVKTAVPYTLTPAVVQAGNYWLGFVADTLAGPLDKQAIQFAYDGGGNNTWQTGSVSSPPDPFGTGFSTSTAKYSFYCDYTAISRTGQEGTASLYINGALDTSSAYTADIVDNTNTVQICPSAAFNVDEISIWNRALSNVEVATHYSAR